jgi:tetratricopeptide (TPR) repeat protein
VGGTSIAGVRLASFAAWGVLLGGLGVGPGLVGGARAQGAGNDFWQRVADPGARTVDDLVTRAQAHLDRSLPGGPSRAQAVSAELLLEDAIALRPRHHRARLLQGDALSLQGRRAEAIAAFERACPLAALPEEEATCTLRLAIEHSRAGRLDRALAVYDRALERDAGSTAVYLNSAEILMAQGAARLPEAVGRYRQALALSERRSPGPERDQDLALALYGLAVALDRDGQPAGADAVMSRAVRLDPRLRLLGDAGGDIFFVPAADVHYYRGLALASQGRAREAAFALRHFLVEAGNGPYAAAAQFRLGQLGAAAAAPLAPQGGPAPRPADGGAPATPSAPPAHPPTTRRWRLVAAAIAESDGPLAAPMLDAAWKGQPRLFEPCFEEAPPLSTRTVRLFIDLRLDGRGVLTRVDAKIPPDWPVEVATCLTERTRSVRFPKPPRPEPTTARLQLVVSMSGKP